MKPFLLILFILLSITTAQAHWRDQHETGWHWYQDPEKTASNAQPAPAPHSDPLTEMAQVRETLDRLRAEAILRPTQSAVHAYIQKQVWASNQANRFSQVWDAVIRKHPELDYALQYPTAQFARHIYLDQQKTKLKHAIERFKTRYGLLFFFNSTCPYAQAMAPILQEVSKTHGVNLTAISVDGAHLREYPDALPDNGIAARMRVLKTPALFAVNPLTAEWFPVATGPMSVTDLEERILAIAEYANHENEQAQGLSTVSQ